MRFRRIVGLGLCVVDHLYVVESLRWTGARLRYTERVVSSGGMTGTALSQAARLGCDAHVLSVVGDDEGGRLVRRSLRAAGVKTGRLVRSGELATTIAVVLVKERGGGRLFLVPDRRALERGAPDLDLTLIDGRTLFIGQGLDGFDTDPYSLPLSHPVTRFRVVPVDLRTARMYQGLGARA